MRIKNLRKKMLYPLVIALLVLVTHQESNKMGLLFIAIGSAVRIWACGYLVKQKQLITAGPYRFIRNPLYFGSFLLGLGFCLMVGNTPLTLLFAAVFLLVYFEQVSQEQIDLIHRYGKDYEQYCQNVPGFYPRLFPSSIPRRGNFSWRQVQKNREYNAILGVLFLLLLMDIVEDMIRPMLYHRETLQEAWSHYLRHIF